MTERFTIEQPEALKEGTTPGPWEWYWDQGIISLRGPGGEPIATDLTVTDADMIAAAPALVDALIAEKQAHQRLQAEVEGLRDALATEVKGPHYEGDYGDGRYSGLKQATASITRILEADNE